MRDPLLKIYAYIDTTEISVELDQFSRADECLSAFIGILRAVGYAEASIKMSLIDAANDSMLAAREVQP